jgi:hypothetical protein
MGERNRETAISEPLEEVFEPALSDLIDEEFEDVLPMSSEKQCLAEKRRKAEQRLEEKRLRDELGYYDLDLDDY